MPLSLRRPLFIALIALIISLSLHSSDSLAQARKPSRSGASKPSAAAVPTPRDVIGFTPGDDRKLASWSQILDYFKRLEQSSRRLLLYDLGKTTLGRPFIAALISSPANLANINRIQEIQRKLADPRLIGSRDSEAEKLIAEGRTVVLITCGIHSTEVGGPLAAMNIAQKLVSDDSPETREILDKCIVLLVPSLNPDGVDIVKNWYDKTLGTPAEGTSPPELYHHYTGHDNNRDWYAFTQVETQMVVSQVQNLWRPQIVHDIHQQGEAGSRFFIPPYVEPWEPNVPPLIQAGVNFMGSAMAWEMSSEGKAGVVISGVYDAWTPARAYQHYHGGIRILSETASCRIATPTRIPFERLSPQIGVDPKLRSWNFPDVWPGGEWKLANIVDYMQSGAFALMRNAARYRERWLRDFYRIGKDAVSERKAGEPFAYLIPPVASEDFWKEEGYGRLLVILKRGDVEFTQVDEPFEADGKPYPAGTQIILLRQPYGAFAKTLLERQHYPDLREYPGGPPRRPYDVTAHTLPLLMGVNVVQVNNPFRVPTRLKLSGGVGPQRQMNNVAPRVGLYKSYAASMDEGWTRWMFDQLKSRIDWFHFSYQSLLDDEVRADNLRAKYDCIILPAQSAASIVNGLPKDRYPAQVAGGITPAGVEALKRFVEDGGTLITLNEASQFAIDYLKAPVKNVLQGVAAKDFYCPGSILKIKLDTNDPLTKNAPPLAADKAESIAWFESSPAFETTGSEARIIARFADANELLLSGWLLGAEKIAGKGALVEVKRGKGRIVMFGFRPQYRGQSIATLPFLFNAIETSLPASPRTHVATLK